MVRKCLTLSTIAGLVIFVIFLNKNDKDAPFHLEKANHKPGRINDRIIHDLVKSVDITQFQNLLKPILIERVVGTVGHENVKNYIVDELRKLEWLVELDTFKANTPHNGKLEFTNIIATYNAESRRYLVLACHYDSKLFTEFVFLGATDSAVPCAMLLYLAKSMNYTLRQLNSNVSLKLIFFDGEEAFLTWSSTDSLYGARHLAQLLETKRSIIGEEEVSELDKIDLLVLLDLLGGTSPKFYSFFRDSHEWYKLLVLIEENLSSSHYLQSDTYQEKYKSYFNPQIVFGYNIDDDHKPFLERGSYYLFNYVNFLLCFWIMFN